MTEEEQAAFVREAVARAHEPVEMHFTFEVGLTIVAQMQLALRHPANDGQNARVARRFVEALIERLAGDNAVIRAGLLAGFDPAHDVQNPRA